VNCPVCESGISARKFLARDPHHGISGEWWVRECGACASLFIEHPPSQEDLARLYPAESYYAYTLAPPSIAKRLLQRVLRYSKEPREPHFASPGSVLDFGCGAGEFLLKMRERGWQCAGVEINPVARAAARDRGLDVRLSMRGAGGFDGERFDYLRANHSLEHVLNPALTLADMCALLKPGGTLFIGVPTASSENARVFGANWWHLCPPLHPFVPSTQAITELVKRAGFVITGTALNSDYGSTAGSLQIALNRGSGRRSNQGLIFTLRPLLLAGYWAARLQDLRGVGDKLEIVARRP
jgi:SAM-dependent methyltransferase